MPPNPRTFGWLEIGTIAEELAAAHPERDPLSVRFTELRKMIEVLPGFREEPGHPVNEKILETIQMKWREEYEELKGEDD
jgi:FeS assembly protein IscX